MTKAAHDASDDLTIATRTREHPAPALRAHLLLKVRHEKDAIVPEQPDERSLRGVLRHAAAVFHLHTNGAPEEADHCRCSPGDESRLAQSFDDGRQFAVNGAEIGEGVQVRKRGRDEAGRPLARRNSMGQTRVLSSDAHLYRS